MAGLLIADISVLDEDPGQTHSCRIVIQDANYFTVSIISVYVLRLKYYMQLLLRIRKL